MYRRELPARLEGRSHPLRVSVVVDSSGIIIHPSHVLTRCFPSSLRLINKLQPGSVKKINLSQLNWHKV